MEEARYKVRVADYDYWREQIKSHNACPVHTDARGYVRAFAAGDYEQAYLIARGPAVAHALRDFVVVADAIPQPDARG